MNNSMQCPFCAEDIAASAKTCIYCGESLNKDRLKNCPYCAESIYKEIKDICPFCNSPLTENTAPVDMKAAVPVNVLAKIRNPVITVLLIIICIGVYCCTFWRSNKEVWQPQLMAAAEAEREQGGSGFSVLSRNEVDFFRSAEASVIFDQGGMTKESVLKDREYYRLIASLFLHFSLIHLLCNMLVLLAAGRCVENLFGWWRFIGIYLVSGIAGGVATLYFATDNILCAGASGAVFGVIGAILGYLLRHHKELPPEERNKLYGSVAYFFIANTIFAILYNSGGGDVRIGIEAHTGGFFAGLLAGLVLSSKLCRQEELSEFAEDL